MASPYLRIAPLLAVLAVGCGVDLPTAPKPVQPKAGEPVTIELSANPGVGPNGGTATITARVLDGVFALVPNTTVTFTATAGTLASEAVQTDDKGIAKTTLTAAPGTVKVSATAGSVHAPETAVTIQPVNVFVPPPPRPPPPPEVPAPPAPPPPALVPFYVVTVAASPTSVQAGTPTTLTATVTGFNNAPPVASWLWDCDTATPATDGVTAGSAPCSYTTAGTLTATVKVTGPGGSPTATATTTVTVTAPPTPVIALHCAQPTPPALTVNCNVSATLSGSAVPTSDITSVDWDWADGLTTAHGGVTASHAYTVAGAGTYVVAARNVTINGTTAKGSATLSVDVK